MLKDAQFLDELSEVLQARFITYNSVLETFCTVKLEWIQGFDRVFKGQVLFSGHTWTCLPWYLQDACVSVAACPPSLASVYS
jgi:hypothetical protein